MKKAIKKTAKKEVKKTTKFEIGAKIKTCKELVKLARAGILNPIRQVLDNDKHAVSEVLHKFKRYLYFRVFQ